MPDEPLPAVSDKLKRPSSGPLRVNYDTSLPSVSQPTENQDNQRAVHQYMRRGDGEKIRITPVIGQAVRPCNVVPFGEQRGRTAKPGAATANRSGSVPPIQQPPLNQPRRSASRGVQLAKEVRQKPSPDKLEVVGETKPAMSQIGGGTGLATFQHGITKLVSTQLFKKVKDNNCLVFIRTTGDYPAITFERGVGAGKPLSVKAKSSKGTFTSGSIVFLARLAKWVEDKKLKSELGVMKEQIDLFKASGDPRHDDNPPNPDTRPGQFAWMPKVFSKARLQTLQRKLAELKSFNEQNDINDITISEKRVGKPRIIHYRFKKITPGMELNAYAPANANNKGGDWNTFSRADSSISSVSCEQIEVNASVYHICILEEDLYRERTEDEQKRISNGKKIPPEILQELLEVHAKVHTFAADKKAEAEAEYKSSLCTKLEGLPGDDKIRPIEHTGAEEAVNIAKAASQYLYTKDKDGYVPIYVLGEIMKDKVNNKTIIKEIVADYDMLAVCPCVADLQAAILKVTQYKTPFIFEGLKRYLPAYEHEKGILSGLDSDIISAFNEELGDGSGRQADATRHGCEVNNLFFTVDLDFRKLMFIRPIDQVGMKQPVIVDMLTYFFMFAGNLSAAEADALHALGHGKQRLSDFFVCPVNLSWGNFTMGSGSSDFKTYVGDKLGIAGGPTDGVSLLDWTLNTQFGSICRGILESRRKPFDAEAAVCAMAVKLIYLRCYYEALKKAVGSFPDSEPVVAPKVFGFLEDPDENKKKWRDGERTSGAKDRSTNKCRWFFTGCVS